MNLRHAVIKLLGITVAISLLGVIAGCKENAMVKNYESDNNLLRVPGQPDATLPKQVVPVLPMTKGSHWDYTIERPIGDGMKLGSGAGRLLVTGPTKIDGQDGTIVQTIVDGKVRKEDVYATRNDGVYLLATGAAESLSTLSPAIKLFDLPIVDGASHSWTGILHYRNSSGFGTALSRVSGHTKLKEEGGFEAYRTDLLIDTTVNGKRESIPSTRWITPGVGVVNQRQLNGSTIEIWKLKSREILPN